MNGSKKNTSKRLMELSSSSTMYKFLEKKPRYDDAYSSASPSSSQTNSQPSQSNSSADIGDFIEKNKFSRDTMAMLLQNHWVPPENYEFPSYVRERNGKEIKSILEKSHLAQFDWLVLSDKNKGLYCKYCVIYNKSLKSKLKWLVREPLKMFDGLLGAKGYLPKHEQDEYHKTAVNFGTKILKNYQAPTSSYSSPSSSVDVKIFDSQENRELLRPIVETIILCGHQNIPSRDDWDDRKLMDDQQIHTINDSVASTEANFKALLNFHVGTDDMALENHSEIADATISEPVQNKLINVCAEIVQNHIFENVKKAKYFSLLFDEATDITNNTQLCLSVRYLHNEIIREDFLTFCNTHEIFLCDESTGYTNPRQLGVALANFVVHLCNKFCINLMFCVGIGIDNCSRIVPEAKTALMHELIEKSAVHAIRCPSSNYILNNSLALVSCRNASMTMRKVIEFANASAKRRLLFQDIGKTPWDKRHDGHQFFQGDKLIGICRDLEAISKWQENETASTAHCLLQTLRSSDFIMSSICLNDVLGVTLTLSKLLQLPTSAVDLKRITCTIEEAKTVLRKKKESAITNFPTLFQKGTETAQRLGVVLKYPKLNEYRQSINVNNLPVESREHYLMNIYSPLLDKVIQDLEDRMSPGVVDLFKLGDFLVDTNNSNSNNLESVRKFASEYEPLIGNHSIQDVENDYTRWMSRWQNEQIFPPQTLSEIIENCDEVRFPTVYIFLNILAALPVSVATNGRSFSTLSRLKTWLRSSTAKNRPTGLALLHIHKNEVSINVKNVIDLFMEK